jgi:hypothetical protein
MAKIKKPVKSGIMRPNSSEKGPHIVGPIPKPETKRLLKSA